MEGEDDTLNIQSLPNEIILMVVNYTSTADIVRFGSTCKQFNELVKSSQVLWKNTLRNTVSRSVYEEIEKQCEGNWYNAVKKYYSLQADIYAAVMEMSAYFYKYNSDITLDDVRQFFNNSFCNGLAYYCTIYILQELIRKGHRLVSMGISKKPFTLTEMYYAKVAVQQLMHSFLAIKWTQGYLKKDLPPEIVLNFFVQWIDPLNMHTDNAVSDAINSMVKLVKTELGKIYPMNLQSVEEMCANGKIKESQIIATISHVMYKEKRISTTTVANLDTLDITGVLDTGSGHDVAIAAIYLAVAKKLGVKCELVAFPNHLFLEWRNKQPDNVRSYKIDLDSGKLSPKGTCPFANNANEDKYAYCPDSLLQFVISTFLMPISNKTWYMHNAIYLLDFLRTNPNSNNKYIHYLPYLMANTHLPALTTPIYVTCLTDEHLKIIALLSYLTKSHGPDGKKLVVKKRTSNLKYAIGMTVKHKEYGYVALVRGWETNAEEPARDPGATTARTFEFGPSQPFYIVVAVNQSERYVAQDQIVDVAHPTRVNHLEDIICREFTHFNGFAYVPNEHKQKEYPDDFAVSEQYRTRASTLYGTEPF